MQISFVVAKHIQNPFQAFNKEEEKNKTQVTFFHLTRVWREEFEI